MMNIKSFTLLFGFLYLLFPTALNAAAERSLLDDRKEVTERFVMAKGCLPDDPYYQAHAVPYREDPSPSSHLSAGIICRLDIPKPLPSSAMLDSVTPVRSQGGLGSCTAFAVVSALECLVSSVSFSEAELYIRAKTKGGSCRLKEGCTLGSYIHLLREGAVERGYFSYEDYLEYVKLRKKLHVEGGISSLSSVLTCSPDYKASIEDFTNWRERSGKSCPVAPKPSWKEETYQVRVDDGITPLGVRAFFWINPFYWALRAVSDNPGVSFDKIVTRSRTVLDLDSYYPQKFHMKPLNLMAPGLATDPLYYLKAPLRDKKPLVVSVMTFVEKETYLDKDGNEKERVTTDYWGSDYLRRRNWIIDLPLTETRVDDGSHAVCLCGYDDTKRAFRLKNSWSPDQWGEKGFAWISYDYIQYHTNATYVIKKL